MKKYSLSILTTLENNTNVFIDDVPKPFQKDLLAFLVGHTFMPRKDGKLVIGSNLYGSWIKKLCDKGFDENVNLMVYGK